MRVLQKQDLLIDKQKVTERNTLYYLANTKKDNTLHNPITTPDSVHV